MNDSAPTVERAPLSAVGFLSQRGIQRVVMIDDAFDPISGEKLGPQAIEHCFAELEQNEELATAIKNLGLTLYAYAGEQKRSPLSLLHVAIGNQENWTMRCADAHSSA